ncbi:HD-GYP domain-containing protein [Kribbella yunnanensis]|uniref:HD-GYP domain-containing protein n=1 Tax=Kribbella yunnanensis TaxID=190194 RepID=A0ABP4RXY1_9ACTN
MVRLVVSSIAALALFLMVLALRHIDDFGLLAGLCLIMLAAGFFKFGLTRDDRMSLDSVVLTAVYVLAGPWAAIVASVFGYVAAARSPVPVIRKIFAFAQRVPAAAAGSLVYTLVGAPFGAAALDSMPRVIVASLGAAIAHQVVNAALVCLMIWSEGKSRPLDFIVRVVAPTFVPMLGYSCVGLLLAVPWLGGLGPFAAFLVLVALARWALSQYEAEKDAQAATMRAFIQVIETKDLYTRGHSERVSAGVGMVGRRLRLPEDRQQALEHAGLLHDVGKVGVPTRIIRKPGRLDDAEMDAIRLHPARGVELIGNIPFLEEVKSAVLHHHEKYDGTGYPAGLSGTNIPYFARIIGIVDAFDSLTSTRSYRPARGVEETLAILLEDRYTHFDPQLVDVFVQVIRAQGWQAAAADQPAPDGSAAVSIDHDDLSLGSSGGAAGSAAGPE